MTESAKRLAKQLKNIGPKVAQQLVDAGIDTPEKLRDLGAEEAFLKIHESGGFCGKFHAAYLYALEGAIQGCLWNEIPTEKKDQYKEFTDSLRKGL